MSKTKEQEEADGEQWSGFSMGSGMLQRGSKAK